jgi:8-oxo-dGTP diphosphatase
MRMKIDLTVAGYIIDKGKVLLVHHSKLDLWLPVGGHIDENETPDDALIREVKEETNLDIEFLVRSTLPHEGNMKKNLALPFCTNVHSVGDHDHYCLFFVCKPLDPSMIKINEELRNYKWFSERELGEGIVPADVRNQARLALEVMKRSQA